MQLGLAFVRAALPPMVLSLSAICGVGLLAVLAQAVGRAQVVPSPGLAGAMFVGLVPTALSVALPVSLLVGVASAARAWVGGGEWLGMLAMGRSARSLVVPLLALSLVAAAAEAGITHIAEPAGRKQVKQALSLATRELALKPGQPARFGPWLVRADEARGAEMSGVFLAAGDLVAAAEQARPGAGGVLHLDRGTAVHLEDGAVQATLRFSRATIPMVSDQMRLDAADLSTPSLRDRVDTMRGEGRSAAFEAMTLYKRTSIPLNLPLLALLALPLGARGWRPAWVALFTTLAWWAAMRICDQQVHTMGPLVAVLVPPGLLAVACLAFWVRWRDA